MFVYARVHSDFRAAAKRSSEMKSFVRRLASADPTVPDSATYEVTDPEP